MTCRNGTHYACDVCSEACRLSCEERYHHLVDELIRAVDEFESADSSVKHNGWTIGNEISWEKSVLKMMVVRDKIKEMKL